MAWILALHVFGVIFWMGSLLVISSLLGVAAQQPLAAREPSVAAADHLMSVGANLGAVVAIIFGMWAAIIDPIVMGEGWMHLKLGLVLLMIVAHLWLRHRIKVLRTEPKAAARAQFAMFHGIISLLLLAILLLVFVRPQF